MDIESILDEVEPQETSVTLCLKGSLVSEYERLDQQLSNVTTNVMNLAGEGPATELVARMDEVREQMLAHEQAFIFRAITPRRAWRNLTARRPVRAPDMTDEEYGDLYHPWVCEVVAASAAEPAMTAGQVERLADKLSDGQWMRLANAAWAVNDSAQGIPFSAAASVLTRSSGEKSKPPEPLGNPAHGSLAGNPQPEPEPSPPRMAAPSGSPPRTRSGRTKTATS